MTTPPAVARYALLEKVRKRAAPLTTRATVSTGHRQAPKAQLAAGGDRSQQQRRRHGQHLAEETDVEKGQPREEQPVGLEGGERPERRDRLDHVDRAAQRDRQTQGQQDERQPATVRGEEQEHEGHRQRLEDAVHQDGGAGPQVRRPKCRERGQDDQGDRSQSDEVAACEGGGSIPRRRGGAGSRLTAGESRRGLR